MSPASRAIAAILAALLALPAAADLLPSVRSRADERQFARPVDVPDDASLEASGAIVGAVRFRRLNVFDPTIAAEDTSLFRVANRIHVVTRESTIATQLLFHAGDRYEARLLRESERILRSNEYLRDAQIRPVAHQDGVVDIEVVTQDTWTLKPELRFGRTGGENRSGFGIEEHNLLGTGALLGLIFKSGAERDSKLLVYSDPNLGPSRWQLTAQYALNSDGRAQSFKLERPFHALDSRWTAGVELRNEVRTDSVYEGGRVIERFGTHERFANLYAGWSAGLREGWAMRWIAGLTHDERHASVLVDTPAGGLLPADRKLVYPWVGLEWVEDDFRETRNQDQIARTEDVALGWQGRFRLGMATPGFGSDRQATLFDGKVSKGVKPGAEQTLLLSAAAAGRIVDGRLEDSLFGAAARYYWRQSARRTLFVGLSVDRGVHLDIDTQLTLGADTGLRGYPFRYRTGQGRWLLSVEQRFYTDWYPFRLFNVGAAVFYDMGGIQGINRVSSVPPPTGQRSVLRDVGVGLRLGNSRSAVGSVVHVDIAYPIDSDASIRKFQFNIEAKRSF